MGKRCKQKIELLTLMYKQRIEEINFEFEKKLKEKDKQIKDLNISKEDFVAFHHKILENMAKNTDSEMDDLKNQIEEKDKEISRLRFKLDHKDYE